jgi:23S rRNA (cytidine1920-2'-O)/16S rRNA (cytidine1409-2'-O)-methyltransferase
MQTGPTSKRSHDVAPRRQRLDTLLVARGLAASREQAKRLILAGAVRVDGRPARKPGDLASPEARLEVQTSEKYVSRGGYKLEAALETFHIDCAGKTCVDIGASTGGFTDCLLQHGAKCVHAVDVGKGQLAWKLRQDPRVVVHEGVNARSLASPAMRSRLLGDGGKRTMAAGVDIVTMDVSFISLTKVMPAAVELLRPGGQLIALIKPQFEAGRKFVSRGGVVRNSAVHERVKMDIAAFATGTLGLRLIGLCDSPLLGPAGNKEFFAAFVRP